MKKLTKILAMLLVVASLATLMVGCNGEESISKEEALPIVQKLMEGVFEINRIHYGDGLEHIDIETNNAYVEMSSSEKYKSLEEIKAFTRSILTERYAEELIVSTFEGRYSAGGGTLAQPRYIEVGDAILVRKDIEPLVDVYVYDLDTIEIKETTSNRINAQVTTIDGNIKSIQVRLEENGWRINSTTY